MTDTTATIATLTRLFRFGATTLQDIDPSLEPEEVVKAYKGSYPFLAHATLGDPEVEGDTLVFPVLKREVQTKGNTARRANKAIEALDAWMESSNPTPNAPACWQEVYGYTHDVLSREPTPITDALLVPML